MLGLFAFFYVSLHFAVYLIFDQFFDWTAIVADVIKRPYVPSVLRHLLLLIPLAITSTTRDDEAAGTQLATCAPAGVSDRSTGRAALCVAGQGRFGQAVAVWETALLLGYRLWWRLTR